MDHSTDKKINKIIPDSNTCNKTKISNNTLRKRKDINACNNINYANACLQRNKLKYD